MDIIQTLLERQAAMTPQEVAALLGKNKRTVRNWLNAGLLPGHRIHGRWMIDPGVLSVWLEGKAR